MVSLPLLPIISHSSELLLLMAVAGHITKACSCVFSCTYIHSLGGNGNEIGPEGVQHLVTALEKMVQLKELQ